jgi:anti-sigma28 factor (negative regulator of flagellin synthesis)
MSEISVIGNAVAGKAQASVPSPSAPTTPVEVVAPAADNANVASTDCVEFSQQAQLLEKLQQLPSVRQERIDTIKNAIAKNSYLTVEKLDLAINRMIDELDS